MSKWILQYKSADFNKISELFSIDPILARIIRNRGYISEKEIDIFLNAKRSDMYDPFQLKDMQIAVDIINEKIRNHSKIRIIGDYDIDGVCASYIMYQGIYQSGGKVDIVIPERIKDGYGLNERLIIEAEQDGIDTIITCDNGIAAASSIALAKSKNMTVIITDHHEIPFIKSKRGVKYILPNADAIINPKQKDCNYPYKGICGALVAYKVIDALYKKNDTKQELLEELLGFAAFATIGDVMELVDENRIVVKEGLPILSKTKNMGLKALLSVCNMNGKMLSPYHIGFILGPCINAAGRLDSAMKAINLFMSTDQEVTYKLALELKDLNEERKKITSEGLEHAFTYIALNAMEEDFVLVVYLEDCHESIAGIIAGRIREIYKKPTFVLTKTEQGVKGSGRSIDAYHMYEKMNECKELLDKYGGHKAAAGLSIKQENIVPFRKALNEKCELTKDDLQEIVRIDLEVPLSYFTIAVIKQFEKLEPFGFGNRKPVFAQKKMKVIQGKRIGQNGKVQKFIVEDATGFRTELISFKEESEIRKQWDDNFEDGSFEKLLLGSKEEKIIHILYYPTINQYAGRERIQFILEDFISERT